MSFTPFPGQNKASGYPQTGGGGSDNDFASFLLNEPDVHEQPLLAQPNLMTFHGNGPDQRVPRSMPPQTFSQSSLPIQSQMDPAQDMSVHSSPLTPNIDITDLDIDPSLGSQSTVTGFDGNVSNLDVSDSFSSPNNFATDGFMNAGPPRPRFGNNLSPTAPMVSTSEPWPTLFPNDFSYMSPNTAMSPVTTTGSFTPDTSPFVAAVNPMPHQGLGGLSSPSVCAVSRSPSLASINTQPELSAAASRRLSRSRSPSLQSPSSATLQTPVRRRSRKCPTCHHDTLGVPVPVPGAEGSPGAAGGNPGGTDSARTNAMAVRSSRSRVYRCDAPGCEDKIFNDQRGLTRHNLCVHEAKVTMPCGVQLANRADNHVRHRRNCSACSRYDEDMMTGCESGSRRGSGGDAAGSGSGDGAQGDSWQRQRFF